MEPVESIQIETKATPSRKKEKEAKWYETSTYFDYACVFVHISSCSPYFYFC